MEFYTSFKAAQKETFRLELLDQYNVDEEREDFAAWKRQETKALSAEAKTWIADLERLRSNGVVTQRVHVVTVPISEYMRYEINFYGISKEDVGFVERAEYQKLEKPFEPKEFWLIDEKHLFVVNYDPEGHWTGFNYSDDGAELKRYTQMKDLLLSKALPLDKFVKRNKISL